MVGCPICYGLCLIMAEVYIPYLSLEEPEGGPSVIEAVGVLEENGSVILCRNIPPRLCCKPLCRVPPIPPPPRDQNMELSETPPLICKVGSNRFLTWLEVRRGNSGPSRNGFTYSIITIGLGTRQRLRGHERNEGIPISDPNKPAPY